MSNNHAEELLVEDCQYFAPTRKRKPVTKSKQVRGRNTRGTKSTLSTTAPIEDDDAMEVDNALGIDWNRRDLYQQQWAKTKALLDDVTAEFFQVYVVKLRDFVLKHTKRPKSGDYDDIPTAIISLSLYF